MRGEILSQARGEIVSQARGEIASQVRGEIASQARGEIGDARDARTDLGLLMLADDVVEGDTTVHVKGVQVDLRRRGKGGKKEYIRGRGKSTR